MTRLILQNSSNGTTITTKSQTFASTGTQATAIFGLTGSVEVLRLWGGVTTTLGANHTAAAYRLNDQTAQPDITLSTGTALSAVAAGSIIAKAGLAAAAVVLINNSAGRVNEPTTLETTYFSPFVLTKKTAATTNIEYRFITTDNPTSGAMLHCVEWRPISSDGSLVAL